IPVFEDVVFQRPVAVPPGRSTTIRVAALVREPGVVEVVLRDASTGFAADHFCAVCRFGAAPCGTDEPAPSLLAAFRGEARLSFEPEKDLYGGVLFHQGRFRRVEGYRRLRATECLADISPDGSTAWFGRYLPDRLILGDPGARDAAIHGIQACIPHATLLPTGVDRVVTLGLAADVPLVLAARERSRHGDDFVYDLELVDAEGRLRERWEGLRLKAVDRITPPESWTSTLLGPHVERRLQVILPGSGVRVSLSPNGHEGSRKAVFSLLGAGESSHRPDGKPEAAGGQVSVSHAGSLMLAVARNAPGVRIGCDLEPVEARPEEIWRGLLGPDRFLLAELIARERGESRDAAATRVWAAAESLAKAGVPHGAPLTLESGGSRPTDGDGWLILRSGDLRIGSLLAPVRELAGPAALAVLIDPANPAEIPA